MSNYPRAHARGSRQGQSRPSLLPWGRAHGRITMNPYRVHGGGERGEEIGYMESQPTSWGNPEITHLSPYSNAPMNYTPQSSSTSSFSNTYPQFGSYTNPMPQFTFTMMNALSNIRGRIMQREQAHQEYQPGNITRGIFTNAIESVQMARSGTRRNPPMPVATQSDREEYAQRLKMNNIRKSHFVLWELWEALGSSGKLCEGLAIDKNLRK